MPDMWEAFKGFAAGFLIGYAGGYLILTCARAVRTVHVIHRWEHVQFYGIALLHERQRCTKCGAERVRALF